MTVNENEIRQAESFDSGTDSIPADLHQAEVSESKYQTSHFFILAVSCGHGLYSLLDSLDRWAQHAPPTLYFTNKTRSRDQVCQSRDVLLDVRALYVRSMHGLKEERDNQGRKDLVCPNLFVSGKIVIC